MYTSLDTGAYLKSYISLTLNHLTLISFTLYDYPELVSESEGKLIEAAKERKLLVEEAQTVVDVHGKVEEIPKVSVECILLGGQADHEVGRLRCSTIRINTTCTMMLNSCFICIQCGKER